MTSYYFKCPYCGKVSKNIYVADPFQNELWLCLDGERLGYDVISDGAFTGVYCSECNSRLDKVIIVNEKGEEIKTLTEKDIENLFFKLFESVKPVDIEDEK